MRRWHMPGEFGDRFGPHGLPLGAAGQYTQLLHPMTYTGEKASSDRFEWPVDDLLPYLFFDWADGDGLAPAEGPALTLGGTVTAGVPTPWRRRDGTALTCSQFRAGGLYSATPVDPALDTDDFIFIALSRHIGLGALEAIYSTRNGAASLGNVGYYTSTGGDRIRITIDGSVADAFPLSAATVCGWHLSVSRGDISANHEWWINGNLEDTDAINGVGSIRGGNGIGVGCRPDGVALSTVDVARLMVFYGAGIADLTPAAWIRHLVRSVFGIAPAQGADAVFTRTTARSWQNGGGVWHIGGAHLPVAGDQAGMRLAPGRVNTARRNVNPQAADVVPALDWTAGVAPTAVDDSVALAAAGAGEWGPNVFEYANTTGNPQYIRMSAQTGNVNARCLQLLIRRTAGAGAVNLGLYDESAGTFVAGAAINDGYAARTLVHGQVPADTDCTMCLEVADGTTVRWIAHDMSEGVRCSAPVPNAANAANAARNLDDLVFSDVERNAEGSFELTVTPLGWSAAEAGIVPVVYITGAGTATLYVNAGGTWELDLDGTTQLDSGVAPADGVANRIRVRWVGTFQSIDVDGVRVAGVYDGGLIGAGSWQLAAGQDVEVANFLTYRNGDG